MKFIHFVFFYFAVLTAPAQIITTVAGTGTPGNSGNGGPATSAQLYDPQTVCADNAGNIYIADLDNHVVRKINSAGIISIFAGSGALGYSGDGGPASSADLGYPYGICVDATGNLYITDQYSHVVRKVDNAGIITTVAGSGAFGYSGDGGPATAAQLFSPCGICADNAGNIYFAEFGNQVIRKVSTTGIISTVAGTADIVGYFGDGGPATSAQLSSPTGVTVDNLGNIYIADVGNSAIRKVDAAGIITTFAGGTGLGYSGDGGPAASAELQYPYFVYADNNGNVYISDTGNGVIRVVNSSGTISTIAGNGTPGNSGDGGPATSAQLTSPGGMCIDNAGNIYVADAGAHVIRKVGDCAAVVITLQLVKVFACDGGNASFTINATNVASYQWQINTSGTWSNVINNGTYSGATSNTLNITGSSTSMNGYLYRCGLTNICGTVFCASATLWINTPSPPSISISTVTNTICAGSTTTFDATPLNEGTAPIYQWEKNGVNTGTNSAMYTANSLADGDVITCVLTSNSDCVTTTTAVSNSITINVTPILTPSITISPSANNICSATPVTFTAAITNGGPGPAFQWKKNGIIVGTNLSSYTDNALANGDVIIGLVTSNLTCVSSATATSNSIVMIVTPSPPPSVTITTATASICPGATATFHAIPVNGGSSPAYQWHKNGAAAGINSDSYTDNNIANRDVINCTITSNGTCVTAPATSNTITMAVLNNPPVALDKTPTLCAGTGRQLDAGSHASYLWNDGSAGKTLFINATGIYYVSVTDNDGCKGSDTVVINAVLQPPSGFLPASDSICSYGSLTIAPTNGYIQYLWSNNSTASSITIDKPGLYWLRVTDNNTCTGKDSILILPKQCLQGFYVPTAFTPNNDGVNDFFKPLVFGNVKSYSLIIYNRWGQIIFQSTDVNKGWNGNAGGIQQDSDVFVWACSYQFAGETPEFRKGSVMLIR